MRVLNVNATIDPVSGGGTAERTFQMSRFIARAGAECTVLTLDLGLTNERRRALSGTRVIALRCLSPRFFLFPLPNSRIGDAVSHADIVHVMGHWTLLNALVYLTAKRLGKPLVFCPAGALPIFGRSRPLKMLYNAVVGRRIARQAAACVAIGANELEHFAAYGIDRKRVTVIPNGVDLEEASSGDPLAFREKFGIGSVPFVLFVGRLNSIKGPDLLLQAFAEVSGSFPQHHLLIAGPDDGMLSDLRAIASQSGIATKVRFLGHISGTDKTGAYKAAQLLVIPSRQEAMSIVVLEAGACGTPVVITDRCGFSQLGESGGGQVVPASVAGIRSALIELLGEPRRSRAMGDRLRDYVRREYPWEAIALKYLRLFTAVLEKNPL
jgi:glycosyltransferase involved in cell wall biosynthesis